MLPLTLQFLIAMIASAINERLQRRLDYALEEVRVLKEILRAATGKDRISFTPDQRRRLALAGIELTPKDRRECCQIIKPRTILTWFRGLAARKYDSSQRKKGRPRKARDIRKLVVKMALENLNWGYTKIGSPEAASAGHVANQVDGFLRQRRASSRSRSEPPEEAETGSVPAEKGVWLHDGNGLAPRREQRGAQEEFEPVVSAKSSRELRHEFAEMRSLNCRV